MVCEEGREVISVSLNPSAKPPRVHSCQRDTDRERGERERERKREREREIAFEPFIRDVTTL